MRPTYAALSAVTELKATQNGQKTWVSAHWMVFDDQERLRVNLDAPACAVPSGENDIQVINDSGEFVVIASSLTWRKVQYIRGNYRRPGVYANIKSIS